MLQFTGSLSSATVIKSIKLYNGSSLSATIQTFSGAVVDDGSNSYVVIDFETTPSSNYTVNKIELWSASAAVATSVAPDGTNFVVAESGKVLRVRFSAKFTGAAYCVLDTTSVNLPYATSTRDGVIRLYSSRDTSEADKQRVVYSASDIDTKLAGLMSDTGFVPWDTDHVGELTASKISLVDNYDTSTKTVTVTVNSSTGELVVSNNITGDAVSSSPTISAGAVTGSNKVVNETYISNIYTSSVTEDETRLVSSGAVYNYISSNTATSITDGDTKLVTADLVHDYIDDLDSNYVHVTGAETVAGSKTFSDALVASTSVSSPSYIGDGILSSRNAADWEATNHAKLPTVQAVIAYVGNVDSEIRSGFADADSDLQSQIDALNAGQNLADIVANNTALASHAISDLQAKGDGDITIGDKVQVLSDTNHNDAATVYELNKGVAGTGDITSSTSGYYWKYIGVYGSDSYTKAEADSMFMPLGADLDSYGFITSDTAESTYLKITDAESTYIPLTAKNETIAATETNDTVPTSLAVYNYVSGEVSTLNSAIDDCLKSDQLVTSISGSSTDTEIPTAAAVNTLLTTSASNYAKLDGGNTFTGDTNTFQAISATTVTASGAVTGASLSAGTGAVTGGAITASTSVSSPSYTGDGILAAYAEADWTDSSAKIPTVATTKSAIETNVPNILVGMSSSLSGTAADVKIGAIGLFCYVDNDATERLPGATVEGSKLSPLGMSLGTNGNILYKTTNEIRMAGTWTLLSLCMGTDARHNSLVLAMRTA